MDIYGAIEARKSVRSYREEPVPEALLQRILEAARLAPSAKNAQEWRFVVVRDQALREELYQNASGQEFVRRAPVVIACCAETNHRIMKCGHPAFLIDVSIAIDHLTLAAAAEGLGTCWIGMFDATEARKTLGIPSTIEIVALLALGYPADPSPARKNRLPLETIVHWDRW